MLTMLGWAIAATMLLNLLTIVALVVAYAWNEWLCPKLARHRARQRAFERLLAHSTPDMVSMVSEPAYASEF
jgi:hypothetical protein